MSIQSRLREQILILRQQDKTYREIADILACSRSIVCYHAGKNQQDKAKSRSKKYYRSNLNHPYERKILAFLNKNKIRLSKSVLSKINEKVNSFQKNRKTYKMVKAFTVQDVIDKFGEYPKCYLTGKDIDLTNPKSFHFDHIIPVARGGDNTIDNLGLCIKEANQAKNDLSLDELLNLCHSILEHHGYSIKKPA